MLMLPQQFLFIPFDARLKSTYPTHPAAPAPLYPAIARFNTSSSQPVETFNRRDG